MAASSDSSAASPYLSQ